MLPHTSLPGRVRVLVVADIRLYRDVLAQALGRFEVIELLGGAPPDQGAVSTLSLGNVDVVLMEVVSASCREVVQAVSARFSARVIVFGVVDQDEEVVLRCAAAGVAGFVSQEATLEDLVSTVLRVAKGEVVCPPRIMAILLRGVRAAAPGANARSEGRLTTREHQIVSLVDQGLSNKEIAVRLGIEVCTVKNHIHHLLSKLGARRRGEAAARARRGVIGGAVLAACLWVIAACRDQAPTLACAATVSGRCWVYLGPNDAHVLTVAEVAEETWIGAVGAGISRYDPVSLAWRPVAFAGRTVRSIVAVPGSAAVWAAVSARGAGGTDCSFLYQSEDRGETWEPRDGGLAVAGHCHGSGGPLAVDGSKPGRMLLGYPRGVALTENGGATWDQVLGEPDPARASTLAYDAVATFRVNGDLAWAAGGNLLSAEQFALRSDDGGRTWAATTQPGPSGLGTIPALLIDPQDADVVLASIWGSLQETRDRGLSWRTVLELANPGRYVHALAVGDTIVVAVSYEEVAGKTDGALGVYIAPAVAGPWTAVATPSNAAPGFAVTLDRAGQVVIGTTRGVWLIRH